MKRRMAKKGMSVPVCYLVCVSPTLGLQGQEHSTAAGYPSPHNKAPEVRSVVAPLSGGTAVPGAGLYVALGTSTCFGGETNVHRNCSYSVEWRTWELMFRVLCR